MFENVTMMGAPWVYVPWSVVRIVGDATVNGALWARSVVVPLANALARYWPGATFEKGKDPEVAPPVLSQYGFVSSDEPSGAIAIQSFGLPGMFDSDTPIVCVEPYFVW
jgi:hypothetical protein